MISTREDCYRVHTMINIQEDCCRVQDHDKYMGRLLLSTGAQWVHRKMVAEYRLVGCLTARQHRMVNLWLRGRETGSVGYGRPTRYTCMTVHTYARSKISWIMSNYFPMTGCKTTVCEHVKYIGRLLQSTGPWWAHGRLLQSTGPWYVSYF